MQIQLEKAYLLWSKSMCFFGVINCFFTKVKLKAFATFNPLEIATEGLGDAELVDDTLVDLLELGNLYYVLKENAVLIVGIMLLAIMISMHFVNKAEKLAEKKADILHKLKILFLIFSIVWILNIIIAVLEFLF